MSESLNSTLFRKNAINNLNSIDVLNSSLKVLNPGIWIWVVGVLIVLCGIIVWGILGTITLDIESRGIIFPEQNLIESEKNIKQGIKDRNDKILSLKNLFNKKKQLYDKRYLTVVELLKAKDEYLIAKEELANPNKGSYLPLTSISVDDSIDSSTATLNALIFINHEQGKKIAVGMKAFILPNMFSMYDYGYIQGEVISISEYPISKPIAYSYLGNMNLVDDFFLQGSPYIAKIRLNRNSATPSGLLWTTKIGPNLTVHPGTMVSVKIIYKECAPIGLISKK
jgi:hypothetical protein